MLKNVPIVLFCIAQIFIDYAHKVSSIILLSLASHDH